MCDAEANGADISEAARLADLELLAMIEEHGWAVQSVFGRRDQDSFAYTVGLSTLGFPELAIFAAPMQLGAALLNQVADRMVGGESIGPGSIMYGSLYGPPHVCAIEMTDTSDLLELHSIYGGVDGALQIVWPDGDGALPWEDTWSLGGDRQPLYGPPPW
ncbi:MAG: hypothetical protein JWN61_1039 [Pseudonocardiales bacterium]|nr:hypothetical protein [Pseudonocardiales bacterium]